METIGWGPRTEIDIQIQAGTKSLSLLIVESGIEHVCHFDLATGDATAKVLINTNCFCIRIGKRPGCGGQSQNVRTGWRQTSNSVCEHR